LKNPETHRLSSRSHKLALQALSGLIRPDQPFLGTEDFMNAVDMELKRRMQ